MNDPTQVEVPNLQPTLSLLHPDRVVQLLANKMIQSGAFNIPVTPAPAFASPLSLLQASGNINSNGVFHLSGAEAHTSSLESIPLPSTDLSHQARPTAANPIAPFFLPIPPYFTSPLLPGNQLNILAKQIQTNLAIQRFNEYSSLLQNLNNSKQPANGAESPEESREAMDSTTEAIESDSNETSSSIVADSKSKKSSKPSLQGERKYFPSVLYEMLQEQHDNDSGIITWLPDGTGFIIHNKIEFENVLLQRYFRGIKFRSFQRQLNIYGFARLQEYELHSYRHKFFSRDQHHLMDNIKRVPIKKVNRAQD